MRWSVWDEFRRMHEEMDRLFEGLFNYEPYARIKGQNSLMPVERGVNLREAVADIFETDKELIATIELPGVDKKDIEITSNDGGVEVKVEKNIEKEEKRKSGKFIERSYTGFYRFIPVPEYVDKERIKATYKNGVLELKMLKKSIKKKGKRIKIE